MNKKKNDDKYKCFNSDSKEISEKLKKIFKPSTKGFYITEKGVKLLIEFIESFSNLQGDANWNMCNDEWHEFFEDKMDPIIAMANHVEMDSNEMKEVLKMKKNRHKHITKRMKEIFNGTN